MTATAALAAQVGTKPACEALGVARASFYRHVARLDGPRPARPMYRLLAPAGQTRKRRDQLLHPAYLKPELLASAPNQLWSWDITKLLGPAKWNYFYLYVVLYVFSRYVARLDARSSRKRQPRQATL